MTADDSEENLSMEDILSSIKNILEENGSAETGCPGAGNSGGCSRSRGR